MAGHDARSLTLTGSQLALLEHMADIYSLFVYYGSRVAQPARVRCFIDLVIERLTDNADFVLGKDELASAQAKGLEGVNR